ncbi:receptor-type tyrosine-protein phosphatase kappa-like [Elgaria multicarinata webbii]|uniref:receptor-type tyrosine-protein phosphatase kappa-like n=1 Tax=Elgaria multicarinata webbii TaxID=159646 RepID=UPI002FCD61CA
MALWAPRALATLLASVLFLLYSMQAEPTGPGGPEQAKAERPQIATGDVQISATRIRLTWSCSPSESCQAWKVRAFCQLAGPATGSCKRPAKEGKQGFTAKPQLQCNNLKPFSVYRIAVFGSSSTTWSHTFYEVNFTTKEGVPDKPERALLDLSSRVLRWKPLAPCKGEILGYQVNITGTRTYNATFLEEERMRLNSSVTEYRKRSWKCGTSYTVTVQGLTSAGQGKPLRWELETGIGEPFVPPSVRALSVYNISASAGTAVLPLEPLPDLHGPIREYQIFVAPLQNTSDSSACRSLELQHFNSSLGSHVYVAAVLPTRNLTWPTDIVIGDGTSQHGFYNAPLHPGRNYTALLRIVSRWKQEETCSCVHYDFSVGKLHLAPQVGEQTGAVMPLIVTALLLLALVLAGLLLLGLVVARKKTSKRKEPGSHAGAVPLQRCRGGASKLHTRIPVAKLLEVLKRFRQVEMEAAATEGDEATLEKLATGRDAEYQKLVSGLLHPCLAGKEPRNWPKNRYKDILPYDESRVVLQALDPTADYINASYVDSYRSPKFFIAAQGPLSGTVLDFWRMIWQEKTPVIVMLTDLVEQNKRKCEQYWPTEEQTHGDITVTLRSTRATPGLITRTFGLRKAGCAHPRQVEQFQCLLWPDHGLPQNPARLLTLVEAVNEQVAEAPATGPVLVHCSAGVGRTGTFIALDCLLKMARSEGHVDVFRCVQGLREQRTCMVQTKDQYAFLYEVLLEGLLCGHTGLPVERAASHHAGRLEALRGPRQSDGYAQEFQALERLSEFFQLTSYAEAQKGHNHSKNRSPEILPADCSRPILMSSLSSDGTPGYINATFVDTYAKEERFIATQLPLSETLLDFWALVWDYGCTALVLLNSLQDLDQTYPRFWSSSSNSTYGTFSIKLSSEEPRTGFTLRTLTVANSRQPQTPPLGVRFWQLDDWPTAQRLPQYPATLLQLWAEVEESSQSNPDRPVLVTCRDGVSRCGLFCATSFLCEQIRAEGLLDVSQAVRMLKRRQPRFIGDVGQYRLCYELALRHVAAFQP